MEDKTIILNEILLEIEKELGELDDESQENLGLTLQPLTGTDVC